MRRSFGLFVALAILVAACGDGAAGPGSVGTEGSQTTVGSTTAPSTTNAPTTVPAGAGGGCSVEVTGGREDSWTGPDNISAFTTDYWYTEDELREQFDFLGAEAGRSFDEVLAAGEPIFTLFLFNCIGPDGRTVSLIASDPTTRSDFPMAPGTYAVTGGVFSALDLGPAEFSVLLSTDTETVWGTEPGGTVTIDSWDAGTASGSFTFEATELFVEPATTVMVTGTFTVTCQASVACP